MIELLTKINNTSNLISLTLIMGAVSVFLPLIFKHNKPLRNIVMVIFSLLMLFDSLLLGSYYYNGGRAELFLLVVGPIQIKFYFEAIGLLFLNMVCLLWPLALVYTLSYLRANKIYKDTPFLFFLALSIYSSILVSMAANLESLYLCYEVLTLSTLPLVGFSLTDHAKKSLRVYFGILISTSICLFLPAIIITNSLAGTTDFQAGGIMLEGLNPNLVMLLLGLYLFGIAKAALFPVHSWLPNAMVAVHPVSALLHAVAVVKVGLFSIFKIIIYIFGLNYLNNIVGSFNYIIILPIITIVFASISAITQTTLKKRLAYSTTSQLSLAILPILTFTKKGAIASILHMLAHSFSKINLFFAAGCIYTATKKDRLDDIKGVGYLLPLTLVFYIFGCLSLVGMPPLAGFVSKYYILTAAVSNNEIIIVATMVLSTFITAYYFYDVIDRAFTYNSHTNIQLENLTRQMIGATAGTTILCCLFFVVVKYIVKFLDLIN